MENKSLKHTCLKYEIDIHFLLRKLINWKKKVN